VGNNQKKDWKILKGGSYLPSIGTRSGDKGGGRNRGRLLGQDFNVRGLGEKGNKTKQKNNILRERDIIHHSEVVTKTSEIGIHFMGVFSSPSSDYISGING